jgi:hypothetical protein
MNTGYISREGVYRPILLPLLYFFLPLVLVLMLIPPYLTVSIMKKKFESLNKTAEENTTGKGSRPKNDHVVVV